MFNCLAISANCRGLARRIILCTLFAFLCLALPGCPHVSKIDSWKITSLDAQKIGTSCDIELVNKLPVPLPILQIKGTVTCTDNNKELATLEFDPGTATSLPPNNQPIHVTGRSTASYAHMVHVLASPNFGLGSEVPITITAKVTVRLPNNDTWDIPDLTIKGKIPILAPPTAVLDALSFFTSHTPDDCTCRLLVKVYNPNKFTLTLDALEGSLKLKEPGSNPANYKLLSSFSLAAPVTFTAGRSSTVPFTVHFVPKNIFAGPQIPSLSSDPTQWAAWGRTVIEQTLSTDSFPSSPTFDGLNRWKDHLVTAWWNKLLDSMTPGDNLKASFATKFKTPHAPFDIPFTFGN